MKVFGILNDKYWYLNEMIQHEFGNASSSPLWVGEDKGNIGFIKLHIWHHEGKPYHNFPVDISIQLFNLYHLG